MTEPSSLSRNRNIIWLVAAGSVLAGGATYWAFGRGSELVVKNVVGTLMLCSSLLGLCRLAAGKEPGLETAPNRVSVATNMAGSALFGGGILVEAPGASLGLQCLALCVMLASWLKRPRAWFLPATKIENTK